MNSKISTVQRPALSDTDAEISQFLVENHEEVAAKLADGREQIARGEGAALEPLKEILREARASR